MVLKNQENKVINLYSVYSYDLNMRGNVNLGHFYMEVGKPS